MALHWFPLIFSAKQTLCFFSRKKKIKAEHLEAWKSQGPGCGCDLCGGHNYKVARNYQEPLASCKTELLHSQRPPTFPAVPLHNLLLLVSNCSLNSSPNLELIMGCLTDSVSAGKQGRGHILARKYTSFIAFRWKRP